MLRLVIEIDTTKAIDIGTKEAVLYALERFGEVKVVRCEAVEPKQMEMRC